MRRRVGLALASAALALWIPVMLHGQEAEDCDGPAAALKSKKAKNKAGDGKPDASKPNDPAKEGSDAESGKAPDDGLGEIFEAVKKKRLDVLFVAQNAALASLTIVNVSDQPVRVRVPVVVAGTPTTPAGTNATEYFKKFGTAPPQIVGGVTSIQGQGAAEVGSKRKKSPGRAAAKGDDPLKPSELTLSPGETRVLPVACVGLEFGKPSPLPVVPYSLADIDSASKKPEVRATLERFAQGKFDQEIAQLIAWHFNGGMTWNQLAESGAIADGKLRSAMKAAEQIEKEIKAKNKSKAGREKNKNKQIEKKRKDPDGA